MIYEETLPASAAERALSRADLFREKPWETAERIALGIAWQLRPQRIAAVPALAGLHLKDFLAPSKDLPDPEAAFDLPEGFAGRPRPLRAESVAAIFGAASIRIRTCWRRMAFAAERAVLFYPTSTSPSASGRIIRQDTIRVSFDRGFDRVVNSLRRPA